jgi:hypothetical protein
MSPNLLPIDEWCVTKRLKDGTFDYFQLPPPARDYGEPGYVFLEKSQPVTPEKPAAAATPLKLRKPFNENGVEIPQGMLRWLGANPLDNLEIIFLNNGFYLSINNSYFGPRSFKVKSSGRARISKHKIKSLHYKDLMDINSEYYSVETNVNNSGKRFIYVKLYNNA